MSARAASAVAAALVALAVATPAAAYVRTRDSGTGNELFWPVPAIPWYVNRDWPDVAPSCRATPGADPALAAVRASFAEWEQPCASVRFVEGGALDELRTGGGGTFENLVVFRRGWCSQHPQAKVHACFEDPAVDCGGIFGCFEDDTCAPDAEDCLEWKTVALTSVLYDPETGRMLDADIEMNAWSGAMAGGAILSTAQRLPRQGWYFTCFDEVQPGETCTTYGQGDCAGIDLRNTVTHEVGHFIGLAHVLDANATMDGSTQQGEVKKRSLAADDVAGVCAIYDAADGVGCACANGGSGGALALLLAALALRRGARPPRGLR